MAWTFGREVGKVASTAGSTAQSVTLAAGASVPTGNVVVVLAGNNGGTYDTAGVTDSKTHTWHQEINLADASFLQGLLLAWTVALGTWVNTDTVTLHSVSLGALVSRCYIMDFTPPSGTVSIDKSSSGSGNSATSFSSGTSAATTGTDDLWVGGIQYDATGALTPATLSPVWSSPTTASQASQSQTLAQRYRNPSGSAGAIFNGTIAAAADYAAGVIALRATGGAAPTVVRRVPQPIPVQRAANY